MKDFIIFKVVNLLKKMICVQEHCRNQAEYNYENNANPAYCSKHKKLGMVNKQYNTCIII